MKSVAQWIFLLALGAATLSASELKTAAKSDPVQMPLVKVTARPLDGFAISYSVRYLLWGPIDDVRFEDVDAGSEPAKHGIRSGDRVISLDGVPVTKMKRKEFEQKFFRSSSSIVAEVQSPDAKETRKYEFQFEPGSWEK